MGHYIAEFLPGFPTFCDPLDMPGGPLSMFVWLAKMLVGYMEI